MDSPFTPTVPDCERVRVRNIRRIWLKGNLGTRFLCQSVKEGFAEDVCLGEQQNGKWNRGGRELVYFLFLIIFAIMLSKVRYILFFF